MVNLGPLETSVSRKYFSGDISCVNLKVAWNDLAKSKKLLISVSHKKCHQCTFSKEIVYVACSKLVAVSQYEP